MEILHLLSSLSPNHAAVDGESLIKSEEQSVFRVFHGCRWRMSIYLWGDRPAYWK